MLFYFLFLFCRSFCLLHRPRQIISESVLSEITTKHTLCAICYEKIVIGDSSTLWAPCCKKNAFFHFKCIQVYKKITY